MLMFALFAEDDSDVSSTGAARTDSDLSDFDSDDSQAALRKPRYVSSVVCLVVVRCESVAIFALVVCVC